MNMLTRHIIVIRIHVQGTNIDYIKDTLGQVQ